MTVQVFNRELTMELVTDDLRRDSVWWKHFVNLSTVFEIGCGKDVVFYKVLERA